jgi:glutaminyl-peptide cyclotransferase
MKATKKRLIFLTLTGTLLIGLSLIWSLRANRLFLRTSFSGQRAYRDVLAQVEFGPRTPGSPAHTKAMIYIQDELVRAGWQVEIPQTSWDGFSIQNIVASRSSSDPVIILGAHYDSRLLADQDTGPGKFVPVPGANDGASGTAVLLELARTLPSNTPPVWLVFFDAEDNGGLDGRDWIMGSSAFVAGLDFTPSLAIIVDMVGDANLDLYYERNSDSVLAAEIWSQAAHLGYQSLFIPEPKYSMIDDHTPFLNAGIPAVDIIDFDYPYWHTAQDTVDKVSPESLQAVGNTLLAWMASQQK